MRGAHRRHDNSGSNLGPDEIEKRNPAGVSFSTYAEQMDAFDSLPAVVRAALRDSAYVWNAIQARDLLYVDGIPAADVARLIAANDDMMRRRFEADLPRVLAEAAATFKAARLPRKG